MVPPRRTQGQTPSTLGSAFFVKNRDQVRQKLPEHSCAVIFSAPWHLHQPQISPTALGDYAQDPNFYYLTGIESPKCVLILFSESHKYGEKEVNELLFYPDKPDFLARFAGETTGFEAFSNRESIGKWAVFCRDFLTEKAFDKIWMIPRDYSGVREPGFLSSDDMLMAFYSSISPGYPLGAKNLTAYRLIREGEKKGPGEVAAQISAMLNYYPQLRADPLLQRAALLNEDSELTSLLEKLDEIKVDVIALKLFLEEMRRVKDAEELKIQERVVGLVSQSFKTALGDLKAGRSEYEIAATLAWGVEKKGARLALPPVVAAGKNSGHAAAQTGKTALVAGSPVVLDLAAQADHYCMRVTRTVPEGYDWKGSAGKEFETLLKAHRAVMAACEPDASVSSVLGHFDQIISTKTFPKMMRVRWINAIGLGLNDLSWPPEPGEGTDFLKENMTLVVESALYGDDYGLVLRDVVQVKPGGGRVLTGSIPYGLAELKAFAAN
ncbi:MAG: aminopeptidase P N-terminal domain-containing protein [Bacteroidia bacterium]|nr:aminopeptidase P N-terminal domain-containing protein [Bacteroidia bacterium]